MYTADNVKTITIYKSHSMADACREVMKAVKVISQANLSTNCTIIVPDHMSLEAERALLAALGGSFNTQIKTFQRLANDVLPQCDNDFSNVEEGLPKTKKYLSKQAGIMALSMIIKKIKEKKDDEGLQCFVSGVTTPGFVENMYDVISMLKYCKKEPKDLLRDEIPQGVKVKARDIAKIYKAYQDYTNDERFVDSADKLNDLRETIAAIGTNKDGKIVDVDVVTKGHFYFYDFDNFTKQELAIIEQLALKSMGVMVACCVGKDPRDNYLYLNDIYNGVKKICDDSKGKIRCDEYSGARDYPNKYVAAIGHNLYRYDKKIPTPGDNFVEIFEGETRVDEVYALACKIESYIREGHRYRDVYVVTSDVAKYSNAVSIVFAQFGIPYYCDRQFLLSDHPYARFVLDYLTMCKNRGKLQFALPVVKNYMFCGDSDDVFQFENYCLKYNVKDKYDSFNIDETDSKSAQADVFRQKFYDLYKDNTFKNLKTVNEYVAAINKLIKDADLNERNSRFGQRQSEKGLEYEAKVTAQVQAKFEKVLEQASAIMRDSKVTLDEFIKMLTAGVTSVKMSVIPVRNDRVVFANMSKARKHDIKFLALLGANQGAMPIVKSDCKLLSDRNIADLASADVNVEPTIYTENKRERFSLFQLLLEPSEKLYVSYPKTDGATSLLPSPFVTELRYIFGRLKKATKTDDGDKTVYEEEIKPKDVTIKIDDGLYTMKQTLQKLVLNRRRIKDNRATTMSHYQFFYDKFIEKSKGNETMEEKEKDEIKQYDVEKYIFKKTPDVVVERGKQLYLKKEHTSVSQLTTFYDCPYQFYFQYGLNVKPREIAEFKSSDLGTILHDVLENYVPDIEKDEKGVITEDDKNTEKKAKAYFAAVMQKKYKSLLADDQLKGVRSQLEREAVRMCKVVKKQLANSKFENFATELSFGEISSRQDEPKKTSLDPLTVAFNGGEFKLNGVIDRVDVLKSEDETQPNQFIIIDYKSGAAASNYNEKYLYIGQKMQLLVYVKAVQEHLKLESGNGKLQLVGFYYFNMHDNFTDVHDKTVHTYRGRTLNDLETVKKIDTKLAEQIADTTVKNKRSEKLALRVSKPNEKEGLDWHIHGTDAKNKTLSVVKDNNQFDNQVEYAMQLIARAGELMTEGYASINPYEKKCDFCDYRSICDFGDVHCHAPRDMKNKTVSKDVIDKTVKSKNNSDDTVE